MGTHLKKLNVDLFGFVQFHAVEKDVFELRQIRIRGEQHQFTHDLVDNGGFADTRNTADVQSAKENRRENLVLGQRRTPALYPPA